MTILGPNGVGKTTLLKCIMGFLPWNRGEARILEKNLNAYSDKELWKQMRPLAVTEDLGESERKFIAALNDYRRICEKIERQGGKIEARKRREHRHGEAEIHQHEGDCAHHGGEGEAAGLVAFHGCFLPNVKNSRSQRRNWPREILSFRNGI